MDTRRPLANLGQICAYTGLSEATIYDQRQRGVGIGALAIKVGRHLRWRWDDVDRWLDAQVMSAGGAA